MSLETLAVIAYKQPVTAPEIQEIRGVNTSGVIKTLLDKRLITTAGRKEVIGRPILYRTSKDFLMRFGLSDLEELPSLKEFEALAREALGTDEGLAPSGSGDESVLDALPNSEVSTEANADAQAVAPSIDAPGSTEAEAIANTEAHFAIITEEPHSHAETEVTAAVQDENATENAQAQGAAAGAAKE